MAFKDTTGRNAMNYYISDLHIGHENILRFDNRPFADVGAVKIYAQNCLQAPAE